MALGLLKAVCMVAPFGGLLLPVGNPGGPNQTIMESDGFAGDGLRGMAVVVFTLAAIGQAWIIVDWWRVGRRRAGLWLVSSIAAVICSALSWWWFSHLLHPLDFASARVPIVATLVLGAAALVLQLVRSNPGHADDALRRATAERFRALPASEQVALQEERQQVVDALLERELVTPEKGATVLAAPLGDWYLLDEG